MEQSKKKKIIVLCILVIGGLLFGCIKAWPPVPEPDYIFTEPEWEGEYYIKYNNEYSIHACAYNSVMCSISLDGNKFIDFSEKHMKIVDNFFYDLFVRRGRKINIEIYDSELTENEKLILKSVIYNDESYLDSISN